MSKHIIAIIVILSFVPRLYTQDAQMVYEDEVYLDFIRSVKFHHRGLFTSSPIIDLGSSGRLELSFDDLEGGDKRFRYKIIHCDRNWLPTDLDEMNYIDGFNNEDIESIEYSIGTFWNYTHYTLNLPNRDIRWTKSGNYILAVYEDEYDMRLAITRRFMVVEPRARVIAQMRTPIDVSKIRTHQEIELAIDVKGFPILNPLLEIEVTILQNGRWGNAITALSPKFIRGDQLIFNYHDKINFPALKELRFADLRSTKFLGVGVHAIDVHKDGIDILLQTDLQRSLVDYYSYDDVNGNYVISSLDDDNPHLEGEYLNAIFTLEPPGPYRDMNIYVIGGFSDWKIKPWNKLKYDYQRNLYIGEIELKQGYYNYYYVVVNNDKASIEAIEGSWYETENDYTILVYYSEKGSRYDRLIAVKTINSLD